jgi:hypothetical protein
MPLVSVIWTWQEGGRLYTRLTTNVPAKRLLAKLAALDLLRDAETVHAYLADRADGGNGYEVLWKANVTWDDLRKLVRL